MRRRLTREGRQHHGNLIGGALLGASAIVLASVLIYRHWFLPQPLGPNNCPSTPAGLQAVLIDSTDVLTGAQQIDVRNRLISALLSTKAELPVGWAVQVWRVARSAQEVPKPLEISRFSELDDVEDKATICRPDPKPNGFVTNEQEGLRRYLEFEDSVQTMLDLALQAKEEPESPILETLQAIGLRFFHEPKYESVSQRRLLIVSDLLQNTPNISQIRDVTDFRQFQETASHDRLKIDFKGVKVTVLYLSRPDAPNRGAHIQWWQRLFSDYGAVLGEVQRITG